MRSVERFGKMAFVFVVTVLIGFPVLNWLDPPKWVMPWLGIAYFAAVIWFVMSDSKEKV